MKKLLPAALVLLSIMSCTKKEALQPLTTIAQVTPTTTAQLTSTTTTTQPAVFVPNKRIAVSCDGNYHDRDDICSVSMELGLIAKAGKQSKVVYFGYNDHYWKTSSSQQTDETNSVLNSANKWGGFDLSKFISVQNHHATAVQMLTAQINLSSASDSLIIAALGPMQVIGQAIAASDPAHRKYVRVISHSNWNNEHAGRYGASEGLSLPRYDFNSYDASLCTGATYITSMGVNTTMIRNQNYTVTAPYSDYAWLQTSTDSRLQEIWYECHDVAAKTSFDCSDAGVIWYILQNDPNGSPSKLHSFFSTPATSSRATMKLMLFNGTTPLDTTIIYLSGAYTTGYNYSEGDRLSTSTAKNQLAALVGSYLLARDCVPFPTTAQISAPLRMYRLTFSSYTFKIVTSAFPSRMSAYFCDSLTRTATVIPLNTSSTFAVRFSSLRSTSDRIGIAFLKP